MKGYMISYTAASLLITLLVFFWVVVVFLFQMHSRISNFGLFTWGGGGGDEGKMLVGWCNNKTRAKEGKVQSHPFSPSLQHREGKSKEEVVERRVSFAPFNKLPPSLSLSLLFGGNASLSFQRRFNPIS